MADYFTPSNQSTLNQNDWDLGSGGVLPLPDSLGSTAHRHLLVQAGKQGTIYLVDRDYMGKFSTTDHVVQELTNAVGGMFASPTLFQNGTNSALIYFGGSRKPGGIGDDHIKAFSCMFLGPRGTRCRLAWKNPIVEEVYFFSSSHTASVYPVPSFAVDSLGRSLLGSA